jgi:diketogulonate reductase-like aldo/keto reductase
LYFELGVVVIPKTERAERLPENIEWLTFRLTKEEADQLRGINQGRRTVETKLIENFGWIDIYA